MSRALHRLGALAMAAALAGCGSTALRDTPPEAPTLGITPSDTFAAAPAGASAPTDADLRWWTRFNDPALAGWVERALANSPDTAIARERVVQAQALLRAASARRGPIVGAEAAVDARSRRATGERALDHAFIAEHTDGVDAYLAVLDAQRELFSAQQQLLSDRLLQLNSEVQLFRALGGGWTENIAHRDESAQ